MNMLMKLIIITTNSERPVANGLTPHFAFGKQRTDSKISGNSNITSWTKVSNHTTKRIFRLVLNYKWTTIILKHARKVSMF